MARDTASSGCVMRKNSRAESALAVKMNSENPHTGPKYMRTRMSGATIAAVSTRVARLERAVVLTRVGVAGPIAV